MEGKLIRTDQKNFKAGGPDGSRTVMGDAIRSFFQPYTWKLQKNNSFYSPNHASCDVFRISTSNDHPRFQPNVKLNQSSSLVLTVDTVSEFFFCERTKTG